MKGKCKTVLVRSSGRGDSCTPLRTWPSLLPLFLSNITKRRQTGPALPSTSCGGGRTASSRVVRVLTRGRGERLPGGEEGGLAAAAAVASSPAAASAATAATAALLLLLLLLCGGLLRGQLLLLGLGRAEVGVLDRLLDVHAVVLPVGEAAPDEVLGLVADGRLRGKLHLGCLQDDVLLQDRRLRLVVSERLK